MSTFGHVISERVKADQSVGGVQQSEFDSLKHHVDEISSTGITEWPVDHLTVNADATKFNLTEVECRFFDPMTQTTSYLTYPATVGIPVTGLATQDLTFVGINKTGVLVQKATPFTTAEKCGIVFLGILNHISRAAISSITNSPSIVGNAAGRLENLNTVLGVIPTGVRISAVGGNLQLKVSAGTLTFPGINYAINPCEPDNRAFAAQSPMPVLLTTRNGLQTGVPSLTLNPNQYDNAGTLTTVPNNNYQVYKLFLTITGVCIALYGQAVYTTLANAIDGAYTEQTVFPTNLGISGPIYQSAALIVRRNTTDLNNANDARFLYPATITGFQLSQSADPGALRFDARQALTPEQEGTARDNAGIVPLGGVSVSGGGYLQESGLAALPPVGEMHVLLNLSATGTPQMVFGNDDTIVGTQNLSFEVAASGLAVVAVSDGATVGIGKLTEIQFPAGTFTNYFGVPVWVGLSWATGQLKFYLNGVERTGGTVNVNNYLGVMSAYANKLRFGRAYGVVLGSTCRYHEIILANRALTQAEREAVTRSDVPASLVPNVVARWRGGDTTAQGWTASAGPSVLQYNTPFVVHESRAASTGVVLTSEQTLSVGQQTQARKNIGVVPTGGVALTGNGGDLPGYGAPVSIPLPAEFEFACAAIFTASDPRHRAICGFTHSTGQSSFTFGHPALLETYISVGISDVFSLDQVPISSRSVHFIGFGRDATGWFVRYGLSISRLVGLTSETPVSLDRFFGGVFGGYGQFGGNIINSALFSRALTSDERLALTRGEWSTALNAVTMSRYEPTGCTSLRWIDNSTNGRDLFYLSRGMTPLSPQPKQTRTEIIRVDTTAPTITKASSLYTVAKTATGTVTLTPLAAIAPTFPIAVASTESAAVGNSCTTNQSTGVITVIRGAPPADGVLNIIAAHGE